MIRCRCGVWTDYGLTCSRCRADGCSYEEELGKPEGTDKEVTEDEEVELAEDDDEEEDPQ